MDKKLKKEEEKFNKIELLKSIPGISTFSALVIIAEIGEENIFLRRLDSICP